MEGLGDRFVYRFLSRHSTNASTPLSGVSGQTDNSISPAGFEVVYSSPRSAL